MKISYRIGNLLNHPDKFIAHGCNAQGKMGSGVAKAIRDRYPKAYGVYAAQHERSGLILGKVIAADCSPHTVLNCITQEFYGRDGALYVSYDAIERAIQTVDELMRVERSKIYTSCDKQGDPSPIPRVGYPLIGGDLGGGDWAVISKIIEDFSDHHQPIVYLLDRKVIQDKNIPVEQVDETYQEQA